MVNYNYLANFLSILSLVSGFISIIFALENQFTFASWAIILSVIFDGLDGQVARKNPIPSQFGKELDSLVDVISFGVAPTILGYIFVYRDFYFWATLALFIYLFSSVFRLAKYNITPKEKLVNCFIGLPTTVSGGMLACFILIYRRYTQSPPPGIFLLLVLLLAFLMVSKIKYPNLDCLKRIFGKTVLPLLSIILIIATVLTLFYLITSVFLPELMLFTLVVIYVLFSPLGIGKNTV